MTGEAVTTVVASQVGSVEAEAQLDDGTTTVLTTSVVPDGKEGSRSTLKVNVRVVPAAIARLVHSTWLRVLLKVQFAAGVQLPAVYVVLAGMGSVAVLPVASAFPVLSMVIV